MWKMRWNASVYLTLITAALVSGACDNLPAAPESGYPMAPNASSASGPAERLLQESLWDFENSRFPLECPNGSFTDEIAIEGHLYERYMMITDANGGFHLQLHTMPVGMRGVSTITGEEYRVQERQQITALANRNGLRGSYRQVVRMFGKESHLKFSLVSSGHYNEGPDGELIVQRDHFEIECR
jgi:hypothetical protein